MNRGIACAGIVAALLLGACTGGGDDVEPTTVASSPSPGATWQLQPVVGERVQGSYDLSTRDLGLGDPPPIDQAGVDTVIAGVGDWLDEHLDTLQRTGGIGALEQVTTPAFRQALSPEQLAVITNDLASPAMPVKAARYQINGYAEGGPQWVSAVVDVTHPDDSVAAATIVFTTTADGGLQIVLAGPETPTSGQPVAAS